MFNFLVAAAPDFESVVAYFNSLPDYVVIVHLLIGFIVGFVYALVCGVIEEITAFFRRRRLKKRLDKSSQELCDYVDQYLERKESEGENDVTSTNLL